MTVDPKSVEVTCVTLFKDHCVQVPWNTSMYVDTVINFANYHIHVHTTYYVPTYIHTDRGGRIRLPKFKFSAKFPIGLHVILQIQIRKFENDCYIV